MTVDETDAQVERSGVVDDELDGFLRVSLCKLGRRGPGKCSKPRHVLPSACTRTLSSV